MQTNQMLISTPKKKNNFSTTLKNGLKVSIAVFNVKIVKSNTILKATLLQELTAPETVLYFGALPCALFQNIPVNSIAHTFLSFLLIWKRKGHKCVIVRPLPTS
ncbi:hypothetical protein TSMEX_011425 [Taenia solium]|eukprot:TsM_000812700 transcript=TsM_000812700 gene=TsM_000812700